MNDTAASGRVINPIISDAYYPWMANIIKGLRDENNPNVRSVSGCTGSIIGER